MVSNVDTLLGSSRIESFRSALLAWYETHQREMPWRGSPDPYAVWISEIMLQQTRVDQVRPYYERFMARFPKVEDLGKASREEVLKAWEGMGYYARARNLHRAARQIVERHDGKIPDNPAQISVLPGIGPYTAAAVLSIAYGRDCPVIDGNVVRVLSRLFHLTDDPATAAAKKQMAALAERLLVSGRAGDFNQAMMELGATVCTPRQPDCGGCPVSSFCLARRELPDPSVLPRKQPRKQRPHHHVAAGIVRRGNDILIVRRPMDGLLGGLWEFPGGKSEDESAMEEFLRDDLKRKLGIEIRVGRALATVRHAFTHFEMTLHGYDCTYNGGEARHRDGNDCRWIRFEDYEQYAFPRAHIRLIETMKESEGSPQPASATQSELSAQSGPSTENLPNA